jgi:biotin carboxyl carrier protein
MATSPAVGFYQPRSGVVPGSRVRTGDPIGEIDVLGVPTEVVAPADGIVGASLVEAGEAVEFGQELVWVELLSAPTASSSSGSATGADPLTHGD